MVIKFNPQAPQRTINREESQSLFKVRKPRILLLLFIPENIKPAANIAAVIMLKIISKILVKFVYMNK